VPAPRRVLYLVVTLVLLASIATPRARRIPPESNRTTERHDVRRPVVASPLDDAPAEVREFLDRAVDKLPVGGADASDFQFHHWERDGKPTQEVVGYKPISGVDSEAIIARILDVDGYQGNIPHVEICRSQPDSDFKRPEKVRCFQVIRVPRVAKIQHELALLDAGTIKGYRVVCWYLLKDKTASLDPTVAARSEYNIGAWLVAPGAAGYALSSWPRRADVNLLQWVSLTSGADALAQKVVEDNIDGMVAWAKKSTETTSP
jgi:hypothetical protein